jgi:hypothetical protein
MKNPIERLEESVAILLPGAKASLDRPKNLESGHWWLDISESGRHAVVEWRPGKGFGVSLLGKNDGYGEGPDEAFTESQEDDVLKRIFALLTRKEA